MKIKVKKLILGNVVNISINRINCSEDNIRKVIDLFEYENVIIEIGGVKKCSSLFQTINSLDIDFTTSLYDDLPYTDIIMMINSIDIDKIIHQVFISECESFSLKSIRYNSQFKQYLYLYNRINDRQLIKHDIIKLSMEVIIDESQIDISFHKDKYDSKQLIKKIKRSFYS